MSNALWPGTVGGFDPVKYLARKRAEVLFAQQVHFEHWCAAAHGEPWGELPQVLVRDLFWAEFKAHELLDECEFGFYHREWVCAVAGVFDRGV